MDRNPRLPHGETVINDLRRILVSDCVVEPPERLEVPPAETGGVPPTEEVKPCKYCDKTFPTLGELGKHMWALESEGGHRETMLKLQKEGLAKRAGAKAEKKAKEAGEPPTPPTIYKGEPDAMGILRNILEKHPDIGEAVKEEILDWARLQEFLSPQTLAYLLGQMRGVSSQTANIVAQKYSMALQKAQLEGRPGVQMPILPQVQPQQPPFQVPVQGYLPPQYPQLQAPPISQVPPRPAPYAQPQPYPFTRPPYQQYQPTYPPYQPVPPYQPPPQPQPKGVTREDVNGMVSKVKGEMINEVGKLLRDDREEREKETLTQVVKDIPKQISEAIGGVKSAEEKETLAQVVKDLPTLISEAMVKGKSAEELPKQIAEAVAKAMPQPPPQPPTPPVTKEEIAAMTAKAASEAAAKVVEAKAKEEAERQRHGELLSAIRSGMATQPVSGYKEDAYRFLGQGMTAAAGMATQKTPMKDILEKGPQIAQLIFGPASPGPKEIAPGATGAELADVVSKLDPRWVKEQ